MKITIKLESGDNVVEETWQGYPITFDSIDEFVNEDVPKVVRQMHKRLMRKYLESLEQPWTKIN